jgi:hypothetical protein
MDKELLKELKQFLSYAKGEGVVNDEVANKLEKFAENYMKNIR